MRIRDPERLRAAIDARGLSYREFARLADVTHGFLGHLIPARGAPPGTKPRKTSCSPETAVRIAGVARVPVDELFENRLASDPSTGDLPLTREAIASVAPPSRAPVVSISGARGKHRRKDQT